MRKIKLVSPFITSSASSTEIDRRNVECTAENLLHAFFFFTFFFSHRCNTKMHKRQSQHGREQTELAEEKKGENYIFFSTIFLRLSASLEKHTSPTLKNQTFPVHRISIKEFILNIRMLHSLTIYIWCYCATPEQLKQSVKIMKACKRSKAKKLGILPYECLTVL